MNYLHDREEERNQRYGGVVFESPEHASSESKTSPALPRDYVLSALRSAALRARLISNEANTIGIGLSLGLISPDAAALWARDAGVLDLVADTEIEEAAARELTA